MCRRCERAKYPENLDVEKRRASWRAKNHRRRGVTRDGDFTPADEQAMRLKAKRCPLCKVKLVDDPYLPASKELDHIIPRHMFGTHTHGNVRIICREVTYSYEQLDPLA
jgi:5-methylcytosine-specific restriction endonuclease McrA